MLHKIYDNQKKLHTHSCIPVTNTLYQLVIRHNSLVAKRLISYCNDYDFVKRNKDYKIIGINVLFIFKYLYEFQTKSMVHDHDLFIPFF